MGMLSVKWKLLGYTRCTSRPWRGAFIVLEDWLYVSSHVPSQINAAGSIPTNGATFLNWKADSHMNWQSRLRNQV